MLQLRNLSVAASPAGVTQEEVVNQVAVYQKNIQTTLMALQEVEQVLGTDVYGKVLSMSAKHALASLGEESYSSPFLFNLLPAVIKDKITAALPWLAMGIEAQLIPLEWVKSVADSPEEAIKFCHNVKGMFNHG